MTKPNDTSPVYLIRVHERCWLQGLPASLQKAVEGAGVSCYGHQPRSVATPLLAGPMSQFLQLTSMDGVDRQYVVLLEPNLSALLQAV